MGGDRSWGSRRSGSPAHGLPLPSPRSTSLPSRRSDPPRASARRWRAASPCAYARRETRPPMQSLRRHAAVVFVALVAFAARSLDAALVFPGGGEVWLDPFDGLYRVRRALFTFERFPALLRFDPFLGFPAGAAVPAPPLYDWLLGAVARAFGHETSTLESVAAWTSPLLAALTVLPIAAAGRALGSAGLGLAAGAIFAVLPIAVNY